jgi:hypothetical protein
MHKYKAIKFSNRPGISKDISPNKPKMKAKHAKTLSRVVNPHGASTGSSSYTNQNGRKLFNNQGSSTKLKSVNTFETS